jgi:hypothetical protein
LGTLLIAKLSTQLSDLTNLTGTQASGDGTARQGTELREDARGELLHVKGVTFTSQGQSTSRGAPVPQPANLFVP